MSGPFLSVNGQRVTTVNLSLPYRGIPVADISLPAAVALTGSVTLAIGNLSLVMALALMPDGVTPRLRTFAGVTTARLVGGFGGWQKAVNLAPYNNPSGVLASTVLRDLAMATGERVTMATPDRSLGLLYAPGTGGPASWLLGMLAGALWWVDAKGITQIAATRPTTTIATPANIEHVDGGAAWVTAGTEDVAAWQPGGTYTDKVAGTVTIAASRIQSNEKGRLRVEVLTV